MKHWRVVAQAALISALTILSASAGPPLNTRWSPIANTAEPTTGPLTTLVRGDADAGTLTVRWNCGQPSSCSVTGPQYPVPEPLGVVMILPAGTDAPGQFFLFAWRAECMSLGTPSEPVLTGIWLTGTSQPVMQQCFHPTETRYLTRSGLPPVQRATRAQLEPVIAAARAQMRRSQ